MTTRTALENLGLALSLAGACYASPLVSGRDPILRIRLNAVVAHAMRAASSSEPWNDYAQARRMAPYFRGM